MTRVRVRELGVPVKAINWVRLHPGTLRDGSPSLLVSMGQDEGGLFVCDIDLLTAHCRQYSADVNGATFPTASFRSLNSGILYIGSAYAGHLHAFDANDPAGGLVDLGVIDSDLCSFPCGIDEGPDGSLYIGAYPGASLTRFDPRTGKFQRFGRMDPADMYFYPRCGADGTLAGIVRVVRPHVQALHPASGEQRALGPVFDTADTNDPWTENALKLVKARDGLLYIESIHGHFRLHGIAAEPVAKVPEPAPAPSLPDGVTANFIDEASAEFRRIRLTSKGGERRELQLDWQGNGTSIFLLHDGPDRKVYGSSILPEHFFRFDPQCSEMMNLGQCSVSQGEAYSMANLGGKIYIASYPGARLSIYDPSKPYRFGEDETANPRDIGRIDDVAFRPRAMLAGPAGKLWIGSIPDYGLLGGTLVNYEPATGRLVSHRNLIPDCSVIALEWLPALGQILVGNSILGGSGTTPRAAEAGFVFWDPVRDEAIATENFGLKGIDSVVDLKRLDDRHVYAIIIRKEPAAADGAIVSRAELLLLDVVGRRVVDRSDFGDEGWPIDLSLRQAADGWFYGACLPHLYRVAPGITRREIIWRTGIENSSEHIRVAGPIIDNTLYFATQHRLRAFDLPQAESTARRDTKTDGELR